MSQPLRRHLAAAWLAASWAALVLVWLLESGTLRLERVGVWAGPEGVLTGPGFLGLAALVGYALVVAPLACAFAAWRLRAQRRALFWASCAYCAAAAVSLMLAARGSDPGRTSLP